MDFEVTVSTEIQKLLKQHKSLHVIDNGKKVKCLRSGHEMPCQLAAILQYIDGKKYKKYEVQPKFDIEKYKDVIVPSNKPGFEHQLFCTLTCRHVNNIPHHIEQHVNGKRFQRAFHRWQKCQETGEPFRANIGRRRERKDSETEKQAKQDEDGDESDKDGDELSDLYPVEDFGALDLSSGNGDAENGRKSDKKKKHKVKDSVSCQVKRTSNQKKTKSCGATKVKKMRHGDP